MPVILFWNTGRANVADQIGKLCRRFQVDILVLAEFSGSWVDLLSNINQDSDQAFVEAMAPPAPTRVHVLSRYPASHIDAVEDDGQTSIRQFRLPIGPPLLVVAVHLPSKLHADPEDQAYIIRQLRQQIARAEQRVGHRNTVVIGDFNVDPFDPAMVAADGLHGMMDRAIARRPARTVRGAAWDFFYNPMWSRLGDDSAGPPGTYFYRDSAVVSFFWHSFDQVLLRPGLLACYSPDGLVVPEEVDGLRLRRGDPNARTGSDHLPVVIRLDMEQEVTA